MKKTTNAAMTALLAGLLLAGCTKSTNPVMNSAGGVNGPQTVALAAAFSASGRASLAKTGGVLSTDSLIVDSAIVVFQQVKFESNVDSSYTDSSGHKANYDQDIEVTFAGPYVVHVRDTSAINFASQTLPAGVYTAIQFKIHSPARGEHWYDSDDFNHHHIMASDSSFVGSGIVVWGKVKKNGAWTDFTYRFYGDLSFRINGTFPVQSPMNFVNVILHFNIGTWFVDPVTGALLDPTNTSFRNMELIEQAIADSFGNGKIIHRDWDDQFGHFF